jgi:hypothetical protein
MVAVDRPERTDVLLRLDRHDLSVPSLITADRVTLLVRGALADGPRLYGQSAAHHVSPLSNTPFILGSSVTARSRANGRAVGPAMSELLSGRSGWVLAIGVVLLMVMAVLLTLLPSSLSPTVPDALDSGASGDRQEALR